MRDLLIIMLLLAFCSACAAPSPKSGPSLPPEWDQQLQMPPRVIDLGDPICFGNSNFQLEIRDFEIRRTAEDPSPNSSAPIYEGVCITTRISCAGSRVEARIVRTEPGLCNSTQIDP